MATNKQIIEFQGKGVAKLKQQYSELEARTKRLESSTRGGSSALGGMVAKLGLTTVGVIAATKAISGVIRVGANFEKTMSNVASISGASGKELQALEKNAKDLGSTTVFTATQVGQLQTEFAKLGFTSKEIQGVTKDTLALASASGSDLATSAAVAGQTLRAFGLDVSETSRVTDTMAASFSSSALDMDKFTNSMQYVAPVAKQVGLDVESTTAMLGTLANAGISGSMAGTSLRRILLELGNESSKLSEKIGFPVKSSEDLQKAFDKLSESGLTTAEMKDLVGQRAISAFGVLLDGVDATEKLSTSFDNASGAAQRMADIQLDNLAGKATLLNSAMEGLGISIFERFSPGLEKATVKMTSLVGSFDNFIKLKTSEKLRRDQAELTNLAKALARNIDKEEVRSRLISEIDKKYPDFLQNMNREKLSADEIQKSLKNVNDQYRQKIRIAVQEEIIAEKLKESAEAFREQTEASIQAEDSLQKLSIRTGVAIDSGKSLEENLALQASKYQELAKAANKTHGQKEILAEMNEKTGESFTELGQMVTFIQAELARATDAVDTYKEAEIEGNIALEEHANFVNKLAETLDSLGIKAEESSVKQQTANESTQESYRSLGETIEAVNEIRRAEIDAIDFVKTQEELSSDEKIQIRQSFNEQMSGMFNTDFAMRRVMMSKQAKLFEQAGVHETDIARFVAEQKKQIRADEVSFQANAVSQLIGGLGQLNEAFKGSALVNKRLAQAGAIIDTYSAATKALASAPPPFNYVLAAAVTAAGLANVANIESQQFAQGGIVQGDPNLGDVVPVKATAGELILNQAQQENLAGGMGGITLNISAPLVDESIVDTIIPAIEKAQRMNLA